MENKKEFHYSHSDFKGSPFLIDDCKNHYTYLVNNSKDNALDVICTGIENNLTNVEILRSLPNVTADNLHAIYSGIKDVRRDVHVNEEQIFIKHLFSTLKSFGFDFDKYKHSKAINGVYNADDLSFALDIIETFVKSLKKHNYDVISYLLD